MTAAAVRRACWSACWSTPAGGGPRAPPWSAGKYPWLGGSFGGRTRGPASTRLPGVLRAALSGRVCLPPSAQRTKVHDQSGEGVRAPLQELLHPGLPAPRVSPRLRGLRGPGAERPGPSQASPDLRPHCLHWNSSPQPQELPSGIIRAVGGLGPAGFCSVSHPAPIAVPPWLLRSQTGPEPEFRGKASRTAQGPKGGSLPLGSAEYVLRTASWDSPEVLWSLTQARGRRSPPDHPPVSPVLPPHPQAVGTCWLPAGHHPGHSLLGHRKRHLPAGEWRPLWSAPLVLENLGSPAGPQAERRPGACDLFTRGQRPRSLRPRHGYCAGPSPRPP